MTDLIAYDAASWAAWRFRAVEHVRALTARFRGHRPQPPADLHPAVSGGPGHAPNVRWVDLGSALERLDAITVTLLDMEMAAPFPPAAGGGEAGPDGWIGAAALTRVDGLMTDLRDVNQDLRPLTLGAAELVASWAEVEAARRRLAGPIVSALVPPTRPAPDEFANWWARLGSGSALMAAWNATAQIESGRGETWEPALSLQLGMADGRVRVEADLRSHQFPDFAHLMAGSTMHAVLVGLDRCAVAASAWAQSHSGPDLTAGAQRRATDAAWWAGAHPRFASLADPVWHLLTARSNVGLTLGPDATWGLVADGEACGQGLDALARELDRAVWLLPHISRA